jgi:chromate transporter
MSESAFLELFSLSSCLPGPTSTQVSFALGAIKKGIPGGLLGGVLFQYPGLMMMSAVGVGAASFLKSEHWWSRAAIDGVLCLLRTAIQSTA